MHIEEMSQQIDLPDGLTVEQAVKAFDVMVNALEKGQGHGSFSLTEASGVVEAIKLLRPLFLGMSEKSGAQAQPAPA
jgi:hypothetical protein